MALHILIPMTAAEYDRRLKDFIQSIEGAEYDVYVDYTGKDQAGNLLRGNPTIGWGVALNNDFSKTNGGPRNPGALDYFLSRVLGIDPGRNNLSATASAHEKAWMDKLKSVLNAVWASDPTASHNGASSVELRNKLNVILQSRTADIVTSNYNANDRILIGTPKTEFKYANMAEVEATFDAFKHEKEDVLDRVFGANVPAQSNERAALYSMAYQGTLTGKMKSALVDALNLLDSDDARAEAWFAIRYLRTSEAWRGYMESALFGLYENRDNAQIYDARAVYRMFTLHRDTILSYDNKTKNQTDLASAKQKIQQAGMGSIYEARTITAELDYAKPIILADLRSASDSSAAYAAWSAAGNAGSLLSTNIYLDPGRDNAKDAVKASHIAVLDARKYDMAGNELAVNDMLIGEGNSDGTGGDVLAGGMGNDLLIGGAGDDVLYGGEGNDVMAGGAGDDYYIINTGDGTDTIEDKEGSNTVTINGVGYTEIIKLLVKQTDGTYKTPDGKIKGVLENTDMVLYDVSTGEKLVILNKDFQEGDFGINFIDALAAPQITTGTTITGDLAPVDFDAETAGIQTQTDAWGNVITDGTAEADRADTLYDTSGNDLINAGGGDDTVTKQQSGADVINLGAGDDNFYVVSGSTGSIVANGGDGRDYMEGGNAQDMLEGDAGADNLHGSGGADLLYGDTAGDTAALISQGATQAASGLQGDLVDGESGDDQIFTGAGNDLVAGGAGDDLIVTGGGNDYIAADWSFWHQPNQWQSWSVTETYNNGAYSYAIANLYTESAAGTGADTIYAGAGDDVVLGERGNDTLYLEDGADKAWGGEGADVILGGAGADIILRCKVVPKKHIDRRTKVRYLCKKNFLRYRTFAVRNSGGRQRRAA